MSQVFPKKTIEVTVDEWERLRHENDKFKWQTRDTCKRAEKAEKEIDRLQAELEQARDALSSANRFCMPPQATGVDDCDERRMAEYDEAMAKIDQALSPQEQKSNDDATSVFGVNLIEGFKEPSE